MDAHCLAPLFAPRAIVVFAGSAASGSSHTAGGEAQPEAEATPHATALLQALKAQRFSGTLQFVSTQTRGTLAEALDYLANDPQTQSILVYMEGIRDARRFMSALRSAANAKPVIVLKAGRHSAGQAAARTHGAAMVGDDEVFDEALRRAGAVRVKSFDEMFSAAKCLASRFRPTGKRLAIVTNGGGPSVLAANRDSAIDGLLAIYSPKPGADPLAFAQAVAECRPSLSKPLRTCWMGDATVAEARVALNDAQIPTYRTPESAVGAFGYLSSFYQNQKLLQQTPPPLSTLAKPDIEGARLVIESVLAERCKVLTEMESKCLLSAFHIPETETIVARSAHEAMMIATQMGFPVALTRPTSRTNPMCRAWRSTS